MLVAQNSQRHRDFERHLGLDRAGRFADAFDELGRRAANRDDHAKLSGPASVRIASRLDEAFDRR